jgi:hypothetical protein
MEVDRDRTRTEAAMALLIEVSSAINKGVRNLDSAIDRVEQIFKALVTIKNENGPIDIAAQQAKKQIEAKPPDSEAP